MSGFLCPLSANTFGIEFLQFAIVDYDSKHCLFEVGKDIPPPADMSLDFSGTGEDVYRKIRYNFSEDVLKLPFIQTTYALRYVFEWLACNCCVCFAFSLVFAVGDREVRDFRMIERHYFRDQVQSSVAIPQKLVIIHFLCWL